MPRKTRKQSRKSRRRTLRRIPRRRGGGDTQSLIPPSSAFGPKIGAPVNSDNLVHKIA